MEFPDTVLRIVADAAEKHGASISKAVDDAERRVRRLSEFDGLITTLVRSAIQELVYDARHKANVQTKHQLNGYSGPAKVVSGSSAAVGKTMASLYSYRIAGTMLGLVQGKELKAIAEGEAAKADGHEFNAQLAVALDRIVPADKRVRDVVTEKRLRGIFLRLQDKREAA